VITFLIEHEKVTYPESLRWLAQKYHITIEETGDVSKEHEDKLMMESLYIINQFAQEYFTTISTNRRRPKPSGYRISKNAA